MDHVDNSVKLTKQVKNSNSSMRCLESSMVHLYNSDSLNMCADKLVIQRLELEKGDLQQIIKKEVIGNVELQIN